MKNLLLVAFCGFMLFSSFTMEEEKKKLSFEELLAVSKMEFTMPEGLDEALIVENSQMNYEFAVRYPDGKFEIRYAIRPLGDRVEKYKEDMKNKQEGSSFADPNKLYEASFKAITLNISNGKNVSKQNFEPAAVKKEFGADWGAISFVEVTRPFSQGYRYCLMVAIHKDDCADAYMFYMTDDRENIMKFASPAFYALRFK